MVREEVSCNLVKMKTYVRLVGIRTQLSLLREIHIYNY